MKLAEALNLRADFQKRIAQLRERLQSNIVSNFVRVNIISSVENELNS